MLETLRHRDFALLWVAGLVSVAGDYALVIALLLHAYELSGSALASGGVMAASLLPRVVLGSVAGVFVDRWDRKRVLIAADLLRAVLLLPLLAVNSSERLWLLYAVRAMTGTLTLFFEPAEAALLPRLVREERLVTANALNTLNDNLGRLGGPVVGGLLFAWRGLPAVVIADAVTFGVSAALILAIRARSRPEQAGSHATATGLATIIGDWRAGLRIIRHNRAIAIVFLAIGIGSVGEGTFGVGFAPLVVDVLKGGSGGAGALMSAQAVGGLIAAALVARFSAALAPRILFAGGLIGLGFTDLGVANSATIASPGTAAIIIACLFMVLAGFPVVAAFAAGNSLLQALTVDAYRGRVFGTLGATMGLATLLGLGIGGSAVDAVGVVPVVSAGAAMWIVGGVLALRWLPDRARVASHAKSRSLAS